MTVRTLSVLGVSWSLLTVLAGLAVAGASALSPIASEAVQATIARLTATYGQANAARITRGVEQAARRWRAGDGDAAAFTALCEANFIADPQALAATADRLEAALEQVDGHLHEVRRGLLSPLDLDTGPVAAVDRLLANVDLASQAQEQLFVSRVAFLALLNFRVDTLHERLAEGATWDRGRWARSRMMDRFADRIPPDVLQGVTAALTAADDYVAGYNIRMDRLVTREGAAVFPENLRLISHWGLRDELAADYGDRDGLATQRMIQRVMERIVRQEIPAVVIDNPEVLWCPETNEVRAKAPAKGAAAPSAEREPDTRYATWLANFRALRAVDPFTPTAPTAIARSFEVERQLPEREVESLLVSVLASREAHDLAALVRARLGRRLEPFDIWYSGFRPRKAYGEAELDRAVGAKYPTAAAFQTDLPNILARLGFAPERAHWLAARIVVDPARGAGHAMGAVRRGDSAHLRTRIPDGGMNYKGYNIAIHELGHNVEQVFSLDGIDRWFLSGVPNTACTEAFAFLFQDRDLEVLGLGGPGGGEGEAALATLWATYEISGVALVEMKAWRFLYAHPDATPAALRESVLAAAREVWNLYFAPAFGVRDSESLAIYSHEVSYPLYLSDYPLGHIISFQLAEKVRGPRFGAEFERIARQGRLTPDAWMRGAVGSPISSAALLAAARSALSGGPASAAPARP